MVDFHTHSNISDGDFSPAMLIREAAKQGLSAIALTDHDTINGLESAKDAAHAENFRFIPGIEINIKWTGGKSAPGIGPGGEFHLLGLGINNPSFSFIKAVDELSRLREARNREIIDRMIELSMISDSPDDQASAEAAWNELVTMAGQNHENADFDGLPAKWSGSLGRPHFASFLVKHKIVRNRNQAFDRYLGAGKPLYVPKEGMSFEEAVSIIRESGGIPVLAHPVSLYVAWGRLPDLIKTLKDMGLMGLEAWHPAAKISSCRRLEDLAKSLGLYVTEGSDFHGSARPERRLGYSGYNRKIEDSLLEAIPELVKDIL